MVQELAHVRQEITQVMGFIFLFILLLTYAQFKILVILKYLALERTNHEIDLHTKVKV